jgi:hypothetical protein
MARPSHLLKQNINHDHSASLETLRESYAVGAYSLVGSIEMRPASMHLAQRALQRGNLIPNMSSYRIRAAQMDTTKFTA